MYEQSNDSRCPVKSLKKLIDLLPIKCNKLFQKSTRKKAPQNQWFKKGEPLSDGSVQGFMQKFSSKFFMLLSKIKNFNKYFLNV